MRGIWGSMGSTGPKPTRAHNTRGRQAQRSGPQVVTTERLGAPVPLRANSRSPPAEGTQTRLHNCHLRACYGGGKGIDSADDGTRERLQKPRQPRVHRPPPVGSRRTSEARVTTRHERGGCEPCGGTTSKPVTASSGPRGPPLVGRKSTDKNGGWPNCHLRSC